MNTADRIWWKEGVIYQIYPRSFYDSNGDGIGDLPGITQKLDYLKDLGVDILWISPFYQSPNDDNGYDVSDFRNIQEEFGTMEDFYDLLEGVHKQGMKLIMDLVPNHTSDEHDWFKLSKLSKDNPFRSYYIWKPPVNGGPPNNWLSYFSGSAWEYEEHTGEYYLHLFTKKQPDLNWENPQVRKEIYDIMKFWLDKGIDGFRLDVIPFISKRQDFPPIDTEDFNNSVEEIYANGPRIHEYLQEMNKEVCQYYDMFTLAEGCGVPSDKANLYVGKDRKELDMLYHFDHLFLGIGKSSRYERKPFTLLELKQAFDTWYEALGNTGWAVVCLGNHDFPRMLSRFGNETRYREASAKLLITLMATQRGSLCIYQGDEIGMSNVAFDRIEDYDDVEAHNFFREHAEGKPYAVQQAILKQIQLGGRDNARTPFQWNSDTHAGFSQGIPWLKVNPNFRTINCVQQREDPHSILNFYKKILALRKSHPVWVYGKYESLFPEHPEVYVYRRWDDQQEVYVLLNFSEAVQVLALNLPDTNPLISNYQVVEKQGKDLLLQPWQAVVLTSKK